MAFFWAFFAKMADSLHIYGEDERPNLEEKEETDSTFTSKPYLNEKKTVRKNRTNRNSSPQKNGKNRRSCSYFEC